MEARANVAPVADALAVADLLDPAELFHEASKLTRHREELLRKARHDRTLARLIDQSLASAVGRGGLPRSTPVRSLRNVRRTALPIGARTESAASLARLSRRRVSTRTFAPTEIELIDLGEALRLTYGPSAGGVGAEAALLRRHIPSPGALFSLELYVAALRVESLDRGIYHYDISSHDLCLLHGTESADRFEDALTSLGGVSGCAAYVVISSVIERLRWKYGARAYRLALLEAGHAGQQLVLAATALDLGVCPIQAFLDDAVADVLGIDGVSELPLHLVGLGRLAAPGAIRQALARGTAHLEGPGSGLEVRPPFDGTAAAEVRGWERADAELTAAFRDLASGRTVAARSRLMELEARLGAPDATIRDYLRLSTLRTEPRIVVGEGVLLHLAGLAQPTDEAAREVLRCIEGARDEMLRRLGLPRAPAVFVEISPRTPRPITLVGSRLVQRKICLPPGSDTEAIRHELVHSICAPPNLVVAEGLACLAASGEDAIRETESHLGTDSRERLLALFRRRAPGTTGAEALGDEDAWLIYPLAGSFLLFLRERAGRGAVERYAGALVVAGADTTADEQEALFERTFAVGLDEAAAEWWQAVAGKERA